ncbi:MAG: TIGR03790 family protein [Azonexaceae bacterium]|nr:TIGR03790 family protein [Azonexaceae bacterium]
MPAKHLPVFLQLLGFALLLGATHVFADTNILLPRTGISADELALLINDNDPLSRETGAYYQRMRRLPEQNVIHLRFPAGKTTLSRQEFEPLKAEIDRLTPTHIQAFAAAWTQPYKVGCMSMTSALAFGYDEKYCSTKCGQSSPSRYFDTASTYPFNDFQTRPAMMLAGQSFADVKALIDRGIEADRSFPEGTAYLLSTSDKTRSVRAKLFGITKSVVGAMLPIEEIEADSITGRQDVLFYFTGLAQVPNLGTIKFMPGALADHLTSFGGQLTDSTQMSSLRWLEAGAAASYGTVTEPCNHLQKFPMPAVAMFHYLSGATAIEAYWKSVAWPGEGLFIGEPLARPFAPTLTRNGDETYQLKLISPKKAVWRVEQADSIMGPFQSISRGLPVVAGRNTVRIAIPASTRTYLRLIR